MPAYESLFDSGLSGAPYGDRDEYWEEQMALTDMLLAVLWARKTGEGARHVGIAVSYEDAAALLTEDKSARQPITGEQELLAAYQHTLERVKLTDPNITRYHWVCAMFGLPPFYRIALLLSLSVYIDRKYEKVFALLNDDQIITAPSLGTAHAAAGLLGIEPDDEELAQICGGSRLFRLIFERSFQPGLRQGLALPLQPHPTIVRAALYGVMETAPELEHFCSVWQWHSPLEDAVTGGALIKKLAALVKGIDNEGEFISSRVVLLTGREGSGRGFAVRHVAQQMAVDLIEVDMRHIPDCDDSQMDSLLLALAREFSLRPSMIFLRWCSPTRETSAFTIALIEGISRFAPLFWISAGPEDGNILHAARIPMMEFEVAAPGYADTAALFRQYAAYLSVADEVDFDEISARYRMLPGTVKESLEIARMRAYADGSEQIATGHIVAGISAIRTSALEGLGKIVNAGYTWDDIVIAPTNLTLMRLAIDHIRCRNVVGEKWGMDRKNAYGRGVCVLFYGAPGTGKTMAAHVMANEAGMELFKVDASQLTSKYIGETSKNLSQVFEHVKGSNVILFFDEADAIFGRRSDVKDATDRYANSDTAFLLQKIEEYDGMTILSTNLMSNIDDAFRRRVTYAINFQSPGQELRETLWRSLISEDIPCQELDFAFLSKFEMTGSGIKSVLLSAAYMAAGEETSLSMVHIARSLQYYMAKLGKTLSRNELAPYDRLVY